MPDRTVLGIDIGSVAVKTVLVSGGLVRGERTSRVRASVAEALLDALAWYRAAGTLPGRAALTGRGAAGIAALLGAPCVNDLFAQASGARFLVPGCRSVIDIGGHDAAYLALDDDVAGDPARVVVTDFSVNSRCAAGTGSFLDQQAARLGYDVEHGFAEAALAAANVPHVAGRCSVFAKSDMIHLQQAATPTEEIVAGLSRALAESFKGDVLQGRTPLFPAVFHGGVSRNAAIVRFLREALGADESGLVVHANSGYAGAIGAALRAAAEGKTFALPAEGALRTRLGAAGGAAEEERLAPLADAPGTYLAEAADAVDGFLPGENEVDAAVGIDIGSISTNVVVLALDGRLLAKRYLWTAGKPVEAVRQGLADVGRELAGRVTVRACGTTGSARYLVGELFGADVIKNEITAQARGAVRACPDVDTIFEIGGQDSKYVSLRDGHVVDFTMNKACAAGTGSFLEEQAALLGISVKDEFANLAFSSPRPAPLGQRCTVFIESDVVHRLGAGESVADLCAGLAYAIAHNYLHRVVEHRPVGGRVLFQGGTAFNRAVAAAFREVTGKPVVVPPHNEVTGAIGIADLAREAYLAAPAATRFRGFDAPLDYEARAFTCRACANACEVREVKAADGAPLYFGHRCERYETRGVPGAETGLSFQVERARLFAAATSAGRPARPRGTVGIPLGLAFHETLPFWAAFFHGLGYAVTGSGGTNRELVRRGLERTTAETCFPFKVFHGHVDALLEARPDFLFLPSVVNMPLDGSGSEHNFNCPMVQAAPFAARAAFREVLGAGGPVLLTPVVHWQYGPDSIRRELMPVARALNVGRRALSAALDAAFAAQRAFESAVADEAAAFLERHAGKRIAVIVSRPYNGADPGLNMGVPRKLAALGMPSLPIEAVPVPGETADDPWQDLYWRYGQRMLRKLEALNADPRFLPVVITNFNCGPDSFLLHYAAGIRQDRPLLFLELDEHSADAGIVTRLEAFLDSVEQRDRARAVPRPATRPVRRAGPLRGKKVFVPNMCDDAMPIAAAFRREGIDAAVLPETDRASLARGRALTSGKECLPLVLTTGDLLGIPDRPDYVPGKTVFFMPTTNGPCRFGEYSRLQRLVLDAQGLSGIELFSPSSGDGYEGLRELSSSFYYTIWKGMVCVDLLLKALHSLRPYTTDPGAADAVYRRALAEVEKSLERDASGLPAILRRARDGFAALPLSGEPGSRPRITLVGEIYVRCNRFANGDVIRRLEELGGEVQLSPFTEWSYYANALSANNNRARGRRMAALGDALRNRVQRAVERRFARAFPDLGKEPDVRAVLAHAAEFLPAELRGEAVVTVGKAAESLAHGAAGVVHVMPFSCMPGLVVRAVAPAVRDRHAGAPWLDLAFEDSERPLDDTALEAFLEQARAHAARRAARGKNAGRRREASHA